ncbi:MAG: AIPR family protein [Verrucomicrobiota bacterium]|nr:AIPR family protein [Verrucomicrobiota bacterium]
MPDDLQEFHQELFQDVLGVADAEGRYVEDTFFEIFCEQLVEAGELETADRAQYISSRGVRVDGYGGDPLDSDGVLNLIIADFHQSLERGTLTATDMEAIFKRLSNFLSKSLDPDFRNGLEETLPAFGLAELIAKRWANVAKIRLFLISNRVLSTRVDGKEAGELQGRPVTYSVWDLGRLQRFAASGHGREDIEIDLEKDFGGPLPALPAHLKEAGYEAYLVAVPAVQLAAIYDRWSARLLEQNVRVFLQARGNVNKGIRNTIENNPEMFFAYNNGITATAEAVTTRGSADALLLTGFKNLQIVNGGQTTASIHAASRKKDVDLSRVFVQMKLSIVHRGKAMEVVPKISEYANSQNRVNAADFFANHPFHIRMEEFSRRVLAPSLDGTFRQSKWFYERARGQYQDERGRRTVAERRKFDLDFPKSQLFSKTDLAKYLVLWRCHPDIVSKGAQKNFAYFAREISDEWDKNSDVFNESFYKHAIAKAIVFKEVEKLVTKQPWYQGGYRANIVAYAISKLAHEVDQSGRVVDFETIWNTQKLPPEMRDAITGISKAVLDVMMDTPSGSSNVTEWAKQQACWHSVATLEYNLPDGLTDELVTKNEQRETDRSAIKGQKILNGIQAQTLVVKAGGQFWRDVRAWGSSRKLLSPMQTGILDVAASIPNKIPSDKQSIKAIEILRKLQSEGCQLVLESA